METTNNIVERKVKGQYRKQMFQEIARVDRTSTIRQNRAKIIDSEAVLRVMVVLSMISCRGVLSELIILQSGLSSSWPRRKHLERPNCASRTNEKLQNFSLNLKYWKRYLKIINSILYTRLVNNIGCLGGFFCTAYKPFLGYLMPKSAFFKQ